MARYDLSGSAWQNFSGSRDGRKCETVIFREILYEHLTHSQDGYVRYRQAEEEEIRRRVHPRIFHDYVAHWKSFNL